MRKRYTSKNKAQIVLEILNEERSKAQIASEYGIHPNQLYKWRAQTLEGLPTLFEDEHKTEKALRVALERELNELYAEIGRLTTQLNWLKKNLASNRSRSECYKLIEREHPEVPLTIQAELLGLSRASPYYVPVGPSVREIAVKHRIDELYTAYPFLGSRKMTAYIRREGMWISRPTVQNYMQELGITGVTPGPNLSKRSREHLVYHNLLRGLKIERSNQVWGINITYIRLAAGWMYLVAILD